MATFHVINLLLFSFFIHHASCQKVGDSLSKISYQTGATYGGGSGGELTLTVNWNGTEFSCATNPIQPNSPYECDTLSESAATRNPSIEYHIYVDWPRTNSPLQITEFTFTDNVGSEYTIQRFCHPPKMQCTLDAAEGITPGDMSSCIQWGSKDSYDNIQLGSGTKFSALYVDIPIFGSRFANQVVEGGVRPPNLIYAGFRTGSASTGDSKPIPVSIQWDTGLYTCGDIFPATEETPYNCTLSDPLHCPAITDFWFSAYSDRNTAEFLQIKEISFEDETNTKYIFDQNFCRDPATPFLTGSACADSTFIDATEVSIGGNFGGTQFAKLVPFFVPDCVFNYSDDASNTLDVDVGVGFITTATPQDSEFGWDAGQYGGPIAAKCPETDEPTSDPTIDPTIDPTSDPTSDPTVDPTSDPTFEPTTDPTVDPTSDPTFDPTTDPTSDPTVDPTIDPTSDPTADPTGVPTSHPSAFPTKYPSATPTVPAPSAAPVTTEPTPSPTKYPTPYRTTEDPAKDGGLITKTTVFWGLLALGIFVICCLFCLFIICWRRRKKKKKAEETTASAANAIAYNKRAEIPVKSPDDEEDEDDGAVIAKQDTYQYYDVGTVNTQLSDEFNGQVEAQEVEEVELAEVVDRQVTLDGVEATGADAQKGNEAVLDALTQGLDGADTGGKQTEDGVETVEDEVIGFQFSV